MESREKFSLEGYRLIGYCIPIIILHIIIVIDFIGPFVIVTLVVV